MCFLSFSQTHPPLLNPLPPQAGDALFSPIEKLNFALEYVTFCDLELKHLIQESLPQLHKYEYTHKCVER